MEKKTGLAKKSMYGLFLVSLAFVICLISPFGLNADSQNSDDTLTYKLGCTDYSCAFIPLGGNKYKVLERNLGVVTCEVNMNLRETLTNQNMKSVMYTVRSNSGSRRFVDSLIYRSTKGELQRKYYFDYRTNVYHIYYKNKLAIKAYSRKNLAYRLINISQYDVDDYDMFIDKFSSIEFDSTFEYLNNGSLFRKRIKNKRLTIEAYYRKGRILQKNLIVGSERGLLYQDPDNQFNSFYSNRKNQRHVAYYSNFQKSKVIERKGDVIDIVYYEKDGRQRYSEKRLIKNEGQRNSYYSSNFYYLQREVIQYSRRRSSNGFMREFALKPNSIGQTITYRDSMSSGLYEVVGNLPDYTKYKGKYYFSPYQVLENAYVVRTFRNSELIQVDTLDISSNNMYRVNYFTSHFYRQMQGIIYKIRTQESESPKDNDRSARYSYRYNYRYGQKDTGFYKEVKVPYSYDGRIGYRPYTSSDRAYSTSKLQIKKDFDRCLFGVWNERANEYVIQPDYMEITKITYAPGFFQVTKDLMTYQIISTKGKVKYESNKRMYLGAIRNAHWVYYKLPNKNSADSLDIYDKKFNRVYTIQKGYGNQILDDMIYSYNPISGITQVVFLTDTSHKFTIQGKLKRLEKNVYLAGQSLYTVDSNGLKEIFQSATQLFQRGKNTLFTADSSSLVQISIHKWSDYLSLRHIYMDNPTEWLSNSASWLLRRSNYNDVTISGKRSLGLQYKLKNKFGTVSWNVHVQIKPVWDKIDKDYFAWKDNKRYLIMRNGDSMAFPHKAFTPKMKYRYFNQLFQLAQRKDGTYLFYELDRAREPVEVDFIGVQGDKRYRYYQMDKLFIKPKGEDLQELSTNGYRKPITGDRIIVFTDVFSGKSRISSGIDMFPKSFDTIQYNREYRTVNPYNSTIWPNLRVISNDSVFKLDRKTQQIVHIPTANKNEVEIGQYRYGSTRSHRIYQSKCGTITYLPREVVHVKIIDKEDVDFLLVNSSKINPQKPEFEDHYRLYNPSTKEKSAYEVHRIHAFGDDFLITDQKGFIHLVDHHMSDLLGVDSVRTIEMKFGSYYIKRNGQALRSVPHSGRLDTLMPNIKSTAKKMYCTYASKKLTFWDYENKILAEGGPFFLNNIGKLDSLHFDYYHNTLKRKHSYRSNYLSTDEFNRLNDHQKRFYECILFLNEANAGESVTYKYVSLESFPNQAYMLKRFPFPKKKPSIYYDGDIEIIEDDEMEIAMDMPEIEAAPAKPYYNRIYSSGDGGYSRYGANTKRVSRINIATYSASEQSTFKRRIQSSSIYPSQVNFMSNGLIEIRKEYYYSIGNSSNNKTPFYLELRDTGYRLHNLLTIVDSNNYDTLVRALKHQISIHPKLWGVTCQADIDYYNLAYFVKNFRMQNRQMALNSSKGGVITINKRAILPLIKEEYRYLF